MSLLDATLLLRSNPTAVSGLSFSKIKNTCERIREVEKARGGTEETFNDEFSFNVCANRVAFTQAACDYIL